MKLSYSSMRVRVFPTPRSGVGGGGCVKLSYSRFLIGFEEHQLFLEQTMESSALLAGEGGGGINSQHSHGMGEC